MTGLRRGCSTIPSSLPSAATSNRTAHRTRDAADAGVRHHRHLRRPAGRVVAPVEKLCFAGYFLTVAGVADLIREMGNRIQARGSGVGSVLNCALHTSAVKPIDTIAKQMWRFNARLPTCS